MNSSSLPTDAQIFQALYDVKRRMTMIAAVLKDRIPLSSDVDERCLLRSVRNQLLASASVIDTLAGHTDFGPREGGPDPIFDSCF